MLNCEREFLLDYAGKKLTDVAISDAATRQYVRNIIYIFNHVLAYGFIEKSIDGEEAPTHYWDIMTRLLE